MSDQVAYAPGGPFERELRLLGDVKGKRVLELGCGTGANAVALAQQGAVVIGIDTSDARLATARERGDGAEVRVDWHHGDFADLAFLRADSIDLVVSISTLSEVDDVARVFRQVERVLKPNAPFVCSYDHPMALCIDANGTLTRSPFDRGPVEVNRAGGSALVYVRTLADVFTDLHRAGLRVDTLLEPRTSGARIPSTVVWRARTDGA
ncbi:MAG: class I SAM-dependent methyltransferase [Acidimicrobiia bacterium]